jgi:acyl carrier protein
MDELKEKLKVEVIETLNLEDLRPEDIQDDTVLFGDELGLDSIDALELIVLLERKYDLAIANAEEGKTVFTSINTMAEFIQSHKA